MANSTGVPLPPWGIGEKPSSLGEDSCDIAEGDLKMDEQNSEKSDSSDVKPKIHILAPNVPQNQLLSNYLTQCTGYPATCGAQVSDS
jgi:hypothetical protein